MLCLSVDARGCDRGTKRPSRRTWKSPMMKRLWLRRHRAHSDADHLFRCSICEVMPHPRKTYVDERLCLTRPDGLVVIGFSAAEYWSSVGDGTDDLAPVLPALPGCSWVVDNPDLFLAGNEEDYTSPDDITIESYMTSNLVTVYGFLLDELAIPILPATLDDVTRDARGHLEWDTDIVSFRVVLPRCFVRQLVVPVGVQQRKPWGGTFDPILKDCLARMSQNFGNGAE